MSTPLCKNIGRAFPLYNIEVNDLGHAQDPGPRAQELMQQLHSRFEVSQLVCSFPLLHSNIIIQSYNIIIYIKLCINKLYISLSFQSIINLRIYQYRIFHHTVTKTCFEMLKSSEHEKSRRYLNYKSPNFVLELDRWSLNLILLLNYKKRGSWKESETKRKVYR